jgi:hypothetical protein
MGAGGEISMNIQDTEKVPAKLRKFVVKGVDGKTNFQDLEAVVSELKTFEPELRTALIQPQAQSLYEDMIALMDQFKKQGLIDLGVSPL